MAAVYTTTDLRDDVRVLVSDADGVVTDADMLKLLKTRYFEWWEKYVERREEVAFGTYVSGSSAVQQMVAYTATGVAKIHGAIVGGKLLPISKIESVRYRRENSGEASITLAEVGETCEVGVDIVSRGGVGNDSITVRVALAPDVFIDPVITLVLTAYPPVPAIGVNPLNVDLLSAKTIMRLVAYDVATLLGRGADTVQDILSPVEASVLAEFGLDGALTAARKSASARA